MKQPLTQKQKIIEIILHGGIGILPTDTLYGLVGSALSRAAVQRIYRLRRRNLKKPMIVLVGSIDDLARFGISPSPNVKKLLKQWWPGKVSVALPISRHGAPRSHDKNSLIKFSYLHRGTGTLAFRMPKLKWLRELLAQTGPLVAPSANFEGEPSAKTIQAAKKSFGKNVDFYLDVGKRDSKPSTLVKIEKGKPIVLREGAVNMLHF